MTTLRDVILNTLGMLGPCATAPLPSREGMADFIMAAIRNARDLEADLELAGKLNPWRPAESAPKDGNDFQGLLFDGMQMVIFYDEPSADSPNHCWHRADGLAYHRDALKGWAKLLPAPPSEDK